MGSRIEWTTTAIAAEITDSPGSVVDGNGESNDGWALYVHSGAGDGIAVKAPDAQALIAWLSHARARVSAVAGQPEEVNVSLSHREIELIEFFVNCGVDDRRYYVSNFGTEYETEERESLLRSCHEAESLMSKINKRAEESQ